MPDDDFGAFMCEGYDFGAFTLSVDFGAFMCKGKESGAFFLRDDCNQVVARGHYSAMRRSQHIHWLRFREVLNIRVKSRS